MNYAQGTITLDIEDLKAMSIKYRDVFLNFFVNRGELTPTERNEIIIKLTLETKNNGNYRFLNGKGKIKLAYDQPCNRCFLTSQKMITPDEYRLVFYPKNPIERSEHYCIKCITEQEVNQFPPGLQRQYYKIAGKNGLTKLPIEVVKDIQNYLLDLRNRKVTKIPISAISTVAGIDGKSCGWGDVKKVCNDLGWFRFTKTGTHAAIKKNRKVVAAYADHLATDEDI